MADAYTQQSSVSVDQAAYNRAVDFTLRPQLVFPQYATVKADKQAMPGSSVVFTIVTDMTPATSTLTETTDVDAVALADSQITVTLAEYGNAVNYTRKIAGTSFVAFDPIVAKAVGWNAAQSFNRISRTVFGGGTNVAYGGTALARNTVVPTGTLSATLVRKQLAALKGANAMPFGNGFYAAIIHPDCEYDLRAETGADKWRDPQTYGNSQERIWNGSTGTFEGFNFVVTSEAEIVSDAGSSTTLTDVYKNYFLADDCVAMAYSSTASAETPQVEIGPVVDKLNRLHPVGWYWLGGFARYRESAIRRVETASSIGSN